MAQPVSIPDFFTAIASTTPRSGEPQTALVASSEGLVYRLDFKANQEASQSTFANLDEGIIYGVGGYLTADGALHVVAATGEGNIYHVGADGEKQRLGSFDGEIVAAISAYASPVDGHQYAVITTGDGSVYHIAFDGQQSTQQKLHTFDNSVLSLSAHVTADNVQHILAACGDGNIHHISVTAGQASAPHWLCHFAESYISMTSYTTPDGLLHIIPATRDVKLYHVTLASSRLHDAYVEVHDGRVSFEPADTSDVSVGFIRFYEMSDSSMMFITGHVTPEDGAQHILVASSEGAIHHISFPSWPAKMLDSNREVMAQFQSMY